MDFSEKTLPKSISRTASFNKVMTKNKDFLWQQFVINFNRAYNELVRNNLEMKIIVLYLRDKEMKRYFFEYKFETYTVIRKDVLYQLRELFNKRVDFSILYRST